MLVLMRQAIQTHGTMVEADLVVAGPQYPPPWVAVVRHMVAAQPMAVVALLLLWVAVVSAEKQITYHRMLMPVVPTKIVETLSPIAGVHELRPLLVAALRSASDEEASDGANSCTYKLRLQKL